MDKVWKWIKGHPWQTAAGGAGLILVGIWWHNRSSSSSALTTSSTAPGLPSDSTGATTDTSGQGTGGGTGSAGNGSSALTDTGTTSTPSIVDGGAQYSPPPGSPNPGLSSTTTPTSVSHASKVAQQRATQLARQKARQAARHTPVERKGQSRTATIHHTASVVPVKRPAPAAIHNPNPHPNAAKMVSKRAQLPAGAVSHHFASQPTNLKPLPHETTTPQRSSTAVAPQIRASSASSPEPKPQPAKSAPITHPSNVVRPTTHPLAAVHQVKR